MNSGKQCFYYWIWCRTI